MMSSASLPRFFILGVPVHALSDRDPERTQQGYCQWILERMECRQGAQVITCNAEMVMQARQDPAFLDLLNTAELVAPDGAGVVWALGRQGIRIHRTPGIELAEVLLKILAQQGQRVAFLGGKSEVLAAAVARWQQTYPTLSLWSHHGYFTPEQGPDLLQDLSQFDPHLVLVGLGSPRQEFWIQRHRQALPAAVWIGVGGSFDIWAGIKQRAPAGWRAHQLEWLYRLYQEPWRWRRMLALPRFAWQVIRHSSPLPPRTPHPDPGSQP